MGKWTTISAGILFLKYLVIFGCSGSLVLHGIFSSCRQWQLLFFAGLLSLRSTGSREHSLQQLQHVGSVIAVSWLQSTVPGVLAHRLSCSSAYGFFPDQGLNRHPLHWQADSLQLSHQGSLIIPIKNVFLRSPGEGNCNPLQYSCLGNPMDRGPWWAIVHGVAKELDMTQQLNSNRSSLLLFKNFQVLLG